MIWKLFMFFCIAGLLVALFLVVFAEDTLSRITAAILMPTFVMNAFVFWVNGKLRS